MSESKKSGRIDVRVDKKSTTKPSFSNLGSKQAECPIPCLPCWQSNGEACFDERCPKRDKE